MFALPEFPDHHQLSEDTCTMDFLSTSRFTDKVLKAHDLAIEESLRYSLKAIHMTVNADPRNQKQLVFEPINGWRDSCKALVDVMKLTSTFDPRVSRAIPRNFVLGNLPVLKCRIPGIRPQTPSEVYNEYYKLHRNLAGLTRLTTERRVLGRESDPDLTSLRRPPRASKMKTGQVIALEASRRVFQGKNSID